MNMRPHSSALAGGQGRVKRVGPGPVDGVGPNFFRAQVSEGET
jgi:hypothetical protein